MKITKGLLTLALSLTLAASAHADWKLPIKVESGGVTANAAIGMEAGATSGYDAGRDVPVVEPGTITAYFSHPEWGVIVADETLSEFYQEVKEESYPFEWQLNIDTSLTSSHTITWVKPDVLPKGLNLYLYPPSGDKINMLTTKSYTFTPSSSNNFTIQASLEGTTPPLAPTIINVTPKDSSIYVEWTDSDPDVAGYKVHFVANSGIYEETIDVRYVNNLTIKKLTNGNTYYVSVTAYNKNGFESSYSAEAQGILAEVIRYYAISGKVKDYKGNGVSGVTMTLSSNPSVQTTTDENGNYAFSGLSSGIYKVTPSKGKKDKFNPSRKTISVTTKDAADVDFTLKKEKK